MTVKNVPPELHRRLKERAERNRRSLNGEILQCLREAALPQPVDPEALLAAARELRGRVRGRLTEARLRALKNTGRP